MSTPVNLNKVRKERARAARKRQADKNAVTFGQSRAQKETLEKRADQVTRLHDGHKQEP